MLWLVSPFVGVQGTSDGAFYGYGGVGGDVNFTPNLVLTPNVAAGDFAPGSGTRPGYGLGFRSGAELAWRFAGTSRPRVAVHHILNAGLGKHNPGAPAIRVRMSWTAVTSGWPSAIARTRARSVSGISRSISCTSDSRAILTAP